MNNLKSVLISTVISFGIEMYFSPTYTIISKLIGFIIATCMFPFMENISNVSEETNKKFICYVPSKLIGFLYIFGNVEMFVISFLYQYFKNKEKNFKFYPIKDDNNDKN